MSSTTIPIPFQKRCQPWRGAAGIEGMQEDGGNDEEDGPGQHLRCHRNHRPDERDGGGQEDHPKAF